MVSNLSKIKSEAISRARKAVIFFKNQNLSRKDIRDIAFKEAKNTIIQMSKLTKDGDKLTASEIDLLAHKATLAAMKSY